MDGEREREENPCHKHDLYIYIYIYIYIYKSCLRHGFSSLARFLSLSRHPSVYLINVYIYIYIYIYKILFNPVNPELGINPIKTNKIFKNRLSNLNNPGNELNVNKLLFIF